MASSSSVSSQGSQKYDVFLNFRGEDVRLNFLSHLILAFNHASLKFFVDYKLERGEQIKSALAEAIQDSKVALTIFSKGYASSEWSLDELVKIMECRENPTLKQTVIPVFYHVTPSDVRNVQRGVFAQDFAKHESDHRSRSKVPRWKAAMEAASYLSGRIVNETSSEADVLIQIVDDVLTNLGGNYPIWNPVDKMSFHASMHAELRVFFHNPKEISSEKVKDCLNIQQQSLSTISGPQGLPQEDLNKVLMSIGGQPSESRSGQRSETSNSHPSSPISYHHGVNSGGLGGNNTNGPGLGGTRIPYSSLSMPNRNCGYRLDLGNGNWGYGYPVNYGNGYCDYHVDLGNGNWRYYVDKGNGNLHPYEWDVAEQAGQGAVKQLQSLEGA